MYERRVSYMGKQKCLLRFVMSNLTFSIRSSISSAGMPSARNSFHDIPRTPL